MIHIIHGPISPSANEINQALEEVNTAIDQMNTAIAALPVDGNFVPKTTTVNGKPLSSNIALLQSDIPITNVYYCYPGGAYATIQAAVNQAVADGASATSPRVVFIAPKGVGWVGDVALPPWVNLCGLDAGKGYAVKIIGQITYTPVTSGDFSTISNLYISAGAGKSCYAIAGTAVSRAFMFNCYLEKLGDTTAVMPISNPNVTITYNYVFSKHNVAGGVHIANSGHVMGNLLDLSGGGQAINQSVGSSYLTLSTFDTTGASVISASGTSTITLGQCSVRNAQANSSGILLANNAVLISIACYYDIPAGTGRIINGPNTTFLFYDVITTANLAGVQPRNTSLGTQTVIRFTQI